MIKKVVKKLIPSAVLEWRARKISAKIQRDFAGKTAAETFAEIYERNIWGGESGEFYSGDGSDEKYANVYAAAIKKFVEEKNVERVVDLGCGDFRVASKFVSDDFFYTGCDVVASLIDCLNEKYKSEKIEFRRVDIIEDPLPDGDLCLIRQVLQHLSNREIARVLRNAEKYKYLIITEHYPNPRNKFTPNLDISHGPNVRARFGSAVVFDQPPFNLKNIRLLLDVEAEKGTRIKTFVVER